jgi:hypothetical protein
MGKAGRIACIILPLVLTFASLICICLIFLGGTNSDSAPLASIYFFRADTSDVHAVPDTSEKLAQKVGQSVNLELSGALSKLKFNNSGTIPLKDFYTVSLWGYCSGGIEKKDGANITKYEFCSKPQSQYYFDPIQVWGLNNTEGASKLFPKPLAAGLATYRTVAKWMYLAFIASLIFTILELVCGILAIFSRWGSMATTIMSALSSTFIMLAAITVSALYGTLTGTFNSVLKGYGIRGQLGRNGLSIVWLAVAFSWGAGLFWMFSTCCCSGRSEKRGRKDKRGGDQLLGGGEKGYQRVASPYMGAADNSGPAGQSMPMHSMGPQSHGQTKVGGGYEPYRHANV